MRRRGSRHALQQRLEPGAALAQRPLAQILVAVAEQIECDERDRHVVHLDALQILETDRVAALVQRHDFAIDDHWTIEPPRPLLNRLDRVRKRAGLLVAQSRPEMDGGSGGSATRNPPYVRGIFRT